MAVTGKHFCPQAGQQKGGGGFQAEFRSRVRPYPLRSALHFAQRGAACHPLPLWLQRFGVDAVNEATAQEGKMKKLRWSMILAAIILVAGAQQASAQGFLGILAQLLLVKQPILLGTTGACNNSGPNTPCTTKSTLVQLNPRTGALIRTIGPVGFTVNGLAWDRTSGKLYATTPPGDQVFHGLITINPFTGAGKREAYRRTGSDER